MSNEQREYALIKHLRTLKQQGNRASLAALRRGLSTPDSAEVLREVLPYVSSQYAQDESMYILVAALFTTHSEETLGQSLGSAMRRVNESSESGSIEQRFVALLDADREQVTVHLRHAIQLCQSRNIGLDYNLLLRHMLLWNAPQRWTQLQWAREFWGKGQRDGEDSSN